MSRLGLPLWLSAVLTISIVGAVGMLIDVVIIRPMLNRGASMFARHPGHAGDPDPDRAHHHPDSLGDQPRTFDEFTAGGPLKIGQLAIGYQLFWVLGCGTALMVLGLWAFFTHTRTGQRVAGLLAEIGKPRRCWGFRSSACCCSRSS